MSMFTNLVKHVVGGNMLGARKISDALSKVAHPLSNAADKFVTWAERHGPEAALTALTGGLIGGGAFLAGQVMPHHVGSPGTVPVPTLSETAGNYNCGYDKKTGAPLEGREPFTFAARVQLAAGAQAINTDLADFMAVAASSDTTTANQFAYNFDTSELNFVVSSNIAASFVETLAVICGIKVIEREFLSKEEAQYSLLDLNAIYSLSGLVTSGSAASVLSMPLNQVGIPWRAHYESTKQYAFVLRTVKAFTSVAALDFTLLLQGFR